MLALTRCLSSSTTTVRVPLPALIKSPFSPPFRVHSLLQSSSVLSSLSLSTRSPTSLGLESTQEDWRNAMTRKMLRCLVSQSLCPILLTVADCSYLSCSCELCTQRKMLGNFFLPLHSFVALPCLGLAQHYLQTLFRRGICQNCHSTVLFGPPFPLCYQPIESGRQGMKELPMLLSISFEAFVLYPLLSSDA